MVSVSRSTEAGHWHRKLCPRARAMAQWLPVPPRHKSDSVSSSPESHCGRTELCLPAQPLTFPCTPWHMYPHSLMYTMRVTSRKEKTTLSGGRAESVTLAMAAKTRKVVCDWTVEWYLYFILLAVIFEAFVCFCSIGNWTPGPQVR